MAKSSILDITIRLLKQGDGDKATIKALAQMKQGWGQAMGIMAAVAGVGYTLNQVYQQTGQVFMDYAANVLQTARATGLSAQESSKLIQVTDDLGVSYETLAKAIKSSADSTDFSIEGLAQASAAYLALTDSQARAKFAQDQYGKSWVDMVAVLEKGPDAIRAMSSSVNQNLILTERSISDYEKWRIELDDFGDSVEGLKVQIGGELVSGLNDAITSLREFGGAMQEAEAQTGRTDLRSRIYFGNLVNEKLENQRPRRQLEIMPTDSETCLRRWKPPQPRWRRTPPRWRRPASITRTCWTSRARCRARMRPIRPRSASSSNCRQT